MIKNEVEIFEQKVEKLKKSLENKAKKQGLNENFGDKETTALANMVDMFSNNPIEKRKQSILREFDNWLENLYLISSK